MTHPAHYESDGDGVAYVVDRPAAIRRTRVSTNRRLFAAMRAHDHTAHQPSPDPPLRRRTYVLAITNRCNLAGPLCYAQGSSSGCLDMSPDRIRTLARLVQADGGRCLSLSGGEPTLHPAILEIVHMLRHELGLLPLIVTNGLRIAREPAFAHALKQAAAWQVNLQLDTLCDETYQYLRCRHCAGEKALAIQNTVAAKLRLRLITTVCGRNLGEVGAVLDYAITLGPSLCGIRFQAAERLGRFPPDLQCVMREDIVTALIGSSARCNLKAGAFAPMVHRGFGHSRPHPDCAVHVVLCIEGNLAVPWTHRMSASACRPIVKGQFVW